MIKHNPALFQARVFEPARLLHILDGDAQAAQDLLAEAIAEIRELVATLSRELAAANWQSAASLMHELRGVCANIGAGELGLVSAALLGRIHRSAKPNSQRAIVDLTAAAGRFDSEARGFLAD